MSAALHRVHDFVWSGEDREVLGTPEGLDPQAAPIGQFGLHWTGEDGAHMLVRDSLGVNKLFFALGRDGVVESANFLVDLVKRGHPLSRIWSVPSGHSVRIEPARRRLQLSPHAELPWRGDIEADVTPDACAARIGDALAATFERLRSATEGHPLYVTLSGGLDSSTIAVLAREHLGPVVALTFELGDAGGHSDDVRSALRVARDLGVEIELVRPDSADLLESIDDVLLHGQDWRDFNVHCALVNWALARAVAALHPDGPRPMVLTGDVMNELMADYSPVEYGGRVYYRLPRMSTGRLRRALVRGLDAGDREVGIFARWGVDCIQPYAMCAAAYAALPDAWVGASESKPDWVRRVMGDRVPAHVYARPKVRAQVGSSSRTGGTLGLLHDHGFDARGLARRFAGLLGAEPEALDGLIRAGVYRFTSTHPDDPAEEPAA